MYITSSENRTFQTLNHFVRLDICFKKKKKKSVLYICRSLDYGRLEFETTKCCMSFREYVPIERTVYRVIPPVTRSTLKIVTDNRVNECIRVFIIYWKTSRRIIIIARDLMKYMAATVENLLPARNIVEIGNWTFYLENISR